MSWSFSIGSIAGIRIRVHLTFAIFLVWIGIAFWNEGGMAAAVSGITYILLLFFCVVLHEFGHILTARRFGSQTLDVVLLPIGGVARMKSMPQKPGQELLVALAGPAVNLAIAVVLLGLLGPDRILRDLSQPGADFNLVSQLAAANLFLALFNLLPAFPMDGGRALRAMLTYRMGRAGATRLAARVGHALAFGFGIYGFMIGNPILMLIALFVYFGASAEAYETQVHQMAGRLRVSDAMLTQFATLPVSSRMADAVDLLVHSTQHDIPITDGMDKMIGLLTRKQVLRALQGPGQDTPVADIMRTDVPAVSARAKLDDALRLMDEGNLPAVAVADREGRLVGMVTLENLGQLMLLMPRRS